MRERERERERERQRQREKINERESNKKFIPETLTVFVHGHIRTA